MLVIIILFLQLFIKKREQLDDSGVQLLGYPEGRDFGCGITRENTGKTRVFYRFQQKIEGETQNIPFAIVTGMQKDMGSERTDDHELKSLQGNIPVIDVHGEVPLIDKDDFPDIMVMLLDCVEVYPAFPLYGKREFGICIHTMYIGIYELKKQVITILWQFLPYF